MRVAVFVSAGLGDALLLVPLVKALKADGHSVTGVFTSAYNCQELFEGTDLFNEIMVASEGLGNTLLKSIQHHNQFDAAYVNVFAATRKNLVMASTMAKEVITNHVPDNLPDTLAKRLRYKEPKPEIHDALQNLLLFKDVDSLAEDDFRLELASDPMEVPDQYYAVQLSAGNNHLKYKNWPIDNWIDLLNLLSPKLPNYTFLLIGDENETELAEKVLAAGVDRVHSVVGQTSIKQLVGVLKESDALIGLDGGPMHICAALGKPTFTLWGISNPILYGYENVAPSKHKVICESNAPKHSWLNDTNADLTAVRYLGDLEPAFVADRFLEFVNDLPE